MERRKPSECDPYLHPGADIDETASRLTSNCRLCDPEKQDCIPDCSTNCKTAMQEYNDLWKTPLEEIDKIDCYNPRKAIMMLLNYCDKDHFEQVGLEDCKGYMKTGTNPNEVLKRFLYSCGCDWNTKEGSMDDIKTCRDIYTFDFHNFFSCKPSTSMYCKTAIKDFSDLWTSQPIFDACLIQRTALQLLDANCNN